jgi:26S proteasome regulatory subunit N2
MHTIAMAYIGTANNRALLKLLHFAVSDVNDGMLSTPARKGLWGGAPVLLEGRWPQCGCNVADVRRSAVTSLGFLLFRVPHQCPPMVSLLTGAWANQDWT